VPIQPNGKRDLFVYTSTLYAHPENRSHLKGYAITPQGEVERWCARVDFLEHYRQVPGDTLGIATENMHRGKRVQREKWIHKNMFLSIVNFEDVNRIYLFVANTQKEITNAVIWLPTQEDLLAEDYLVCTTRFKKLPS